MMKWFSKKQPDTSQIQPILAENPADIQPVETVSLITRFKKGLSKTSAQLGQGVARLLLGKKEINSELIEELENLLLRADIGLETTAHLIKQLQETLHRNQLNDGDTIFSTLKLQMINILEQNSQPLIIPEKAHKPCVILMIGVNGAGKTTTIGKLVQNYKAQNKTIMLAAGDTFRAAAIEQLCAWGERNHVPVISQHTGADSASVIFDALQASTARQIDLLIADTAGRLHTQNNLMSELKKIKRVLQKLDPDAPHEIMLVLDASIGQNALNQVREFHQAVGVTGITMTKLDGTAKGGILFAIAHEFKIPFRYLGLGEGMDDLQPFNATQFVEAIFTNDNI